MKLSWEHYLGNNPALYARKVLKECGLKVPPTSEDTVADYLGLELREITQELIDEYLNHTPQRPGLHKMLNTACAWLQREPNGKARIWVHQDTQFERKRLGIFHECGHAIIPWHKAFDYFCSDKDVAPTVQGQVEREAFGFGSELLMPREMFVEDALSLEIGVSAIEELRSRYVASMEATAIWYAHTHPGYCAIVIVESPENENPKDFTQGDTTPGQELLPLGLPPRPIILKEEKRPPLVVKYSVKSQRFPQYIPAGTGIEEGTPVFEAWATGRRWRVEIPASAFGSSAKRNYHAECVPLGNGGMGLVLLWLPDRQLKLKFNDGGIL